MQAAKLRAARYTYVPAFGLIVHVSLLPFFWTSVVAMTFTRCSTSTGPTTCEHVTVKNRSLQDAFRLPR
jgi:hypothetical protein